MKIPQSLDEWTHAAIMELATNKASEPAAFEFKGAAILGDPNGIKSMSKAVAAFANTGGGFIIIGVGEDGNDWAPTGVVRDKEINKKVNDRIKVHPPLSYAAPVDVRFPKDPARSFYVLEIPDTDDGPYASVAERTPLFYERTHSGSEPMTWNVIRDRMVRVEERRSRSRLLLHELDQQLGVARLHILISAKETEPNFGMFETAAIQRMLDDLHALIADNAHLVEAASAAVSLMREFNVELEYRLNIIATTQGTGRQRTINQTKERLSGRAQEVWKAINAFRVHLGAHFNLPAPPYAVP